MVSIKSGLEANNSRKLIKEGVGRVGVVAEDWGRHPDGQVDVLIEKE